MKRFLVIPNLKKDKDLAVTLKAIRILLNAGATVYVQESVASFCDQRVSILSDGNLPLDAEALITIGGDGTVLESSRLSLRLQIPLLGINLGRLGYMAELEPDRLEDLERLLHNDYILKNLMTLRVTLFRNGRSWDLPRLAVNDVVFYRSSIGHVVTLGLSSISSKTEIKYMADGLILATPTGSTAYSLSAGGPVLSSEVAAICATPICPHSFFNRSLLYNENEILRIRNMSSENGMTVTIDGRENICLEPCDSVTIQKSPVLFQIISFDKKDFIGILQQKMKISE